MEGSVIYPLYLGKKKKKSYYVKLSNVLHRLSTNQYYNVKPKFFFFFFYFLLTSQNFDTSTFESSQFYTSLLLKK